MLLRRIIVVVLLALASLGAVLAVTHYRVYVVRTGSMGTTIPSRSVVLVDRGPADVGEVISFRTHDGEVVTHRLVAVNPDGTYQTKGDANDTADISSVAPDAVVGPVVWSHGDVGAWLYWLKQPTGTAALVCGILAMFFLAGFSEDGRPRHVAQRRRKPGAHRAG